MDEFHLLEDGVLCSHLSQLIPFSHSYVVDYIQICGTEHFTKIV